MIGEGGLVVVRGEEGGGRGVVEGVEVMVVEALSKEWKPCAFVQTR
jgi:hypothetical protein